jgi:hypothetical protein
MSMCRTQKRKNINLITSVSAVVFRKDANTFSLGVFIDDANLGSGGRALI